MNGSYSVPIGSSRSPIQRVRQAERGQQDEQVVLGDAELDVLAGRREIPVEGRRDALALEGVGERLAGEQAAPVDPRPEIGRDRHVGRGGDDARRRAVRRRAAELVEQRAEAGLRRHRRPGSSTVELGRHRERARAGSRRVGRARERHAVEERLQLRRRRRRALRTGPIRGPAARSCRRGTSPSAPASSGRRGCPCGRRSGRPKPLMV